MVLEVVRVGKSLLARRTPEPVAAVIVEQVAAVEDDALTVLAAVGADALGDAGLLGVSAAPVVPVGDLGTGHEAALAALVLCAQMRLNGDLSLLVLFSVFPTRIGLA